jgi:hypothetical protein
MARCPFATWTPVPIRDSQKRPIVPQGLVLHTAVSNGTVVKPVGTVRWHFYCNADGGLHQFFDTEIPAACQLDGNYWESFGEGRGFVSVETWDGAGKVWDGRNVNRLPAWTPAQLATLTKLGAWLHDEHGIPLAPATGPRGRGIGYHAQFTGSGIRWNESHACPGPARIRQVPTLIAAMAKAAVGAATTPRPQPEDDDMTPAQAKQLDEVHAALATIGSTYKQAKQEPDRYEDIQAKLSLVRNDGVAVKAGLESLEGTVAALVDQVSALATLVTKEQR